ncbi:hypothetical protein BH09VER1_BH09VER1_51260 [soil metagenome]
MTPFEQQLAETPLREIPAEWRARMLPPAPPAKERRDWRAALAGLLWPHPLAWGAVAACWLVIVGLNFTGPRGPELYTVSPPGTRHVVGDPNDPMCAWNLERRYMRLSEASDRRRVLVYWREEL